VSVPAAPDADNRLNRFHTRAARDSLLREAGVNPSIAMTPEDRDLFAKTPYFTAGIFTKLFGGTPIVERPQSRVDTLCLNREAQPYAPCSAGASGLVLLNSPDAAVLEDTCETFLLFLDMNPKLRSGEKPIRYLGTYTKVPIVHATLEPEEWLSLPDIVSGIFQHLLFSTWLVRLFLMVAAVS
jgi:hypothetical protein